MSDGIQRITYSTIGLYQSGLKCFNWITLWFWKGFSEEISPRRPRESVVTRLTNLSSDLGSAQRGEVKTVFLKGFLICRPETIGSHSHATAFHLWPPAHLTPPHAPSGSQGTHWCGSPVQRIPGRTHSETSSHRRHRCRRCSCREETETHRIKWRGHNIKNNWSYYDALWMIFSYVSTATLI